MASEHMFKMPLTTAQEYKETVQDVIHKMVDHINSRGQRYIGCFFY